MILGRFNHPNYTKQSSSNYSSLHIQIIRISVLKIRAILKVSAFVRLCTYSHFRTLGAGRYCVLSFSTYKPEVNPCLQRHTSYDTAMYRSRRIIRSRDKDRIHVLAACNPIRAAH